ncbi:EndoU domain-containing protein [Enterobacter sp.]|uniref:EndoU domain-containing protein n=1 Tax=Enterobacter sp. TaxID=42895 RepID=UPI00296EF274|nr:EndoU domain-containing protein [Enterobacter sp.]
MFSTSARRYGAPLTFSGRIICVANWITFHTTFPQSWDSKKIISEVDDIVNSPSTKWYAQQGTGGALTKSGKAATWVAWEVRDGVQIRVVYQPAKGRIVTAFPDSSSIPGLPGAK